jgi:phage I-like protein
MKLRCHSPFELAGTVLADGSVSVEHKVLVYGEQAQRRRDGSLRKFAVTRADADEMERNCAADLAVGYEAPIFLGHPEDRSTAPAMGWVKGVRAADDGVYATLCFRPEAAEAIKSGALKYVSPTFVSEYEDQRGKSCGAKLLDVGVLNTPHQKDLGPIPLAESAYQLSEVEAPEVPGEDSSIQPETLAGDQPMTTPNTELDGFTARLTALEEKFNGFLDSMKKKDEEAPKEQSSPAAMQALSASVDALAQQVVELKASAPKAADPGAEAKLVVELKALLHEQGETVADLKRAKDQRDICDLIQLGVDAGTLELSETPHFGTDKFDAPKWLAESRFNGIRGLRMHVATSKPVATPVRKSLPTGDVSKSSGSISLSEIPFDPKTFGSREEFEKFAADRPAVR